MNDISKILIQTTNKMMKEFCTKKIINDSEKGIWATDLWEIITEAGMGLAGVPEENGGIGCSYTDALSILKIAGKFSAPIPLAETMISNWTLVKHGLEVSLDPLTFSIPKENEEFLMEKESNGWIISGKATSVPWARYAKQILIIGKNKSQHVLAMVNMNHARIELGQNLAGEARDHVIFEEILVNDCTVIPIDYSAVKKTLLYSGAVARTMMIAGALENLLEMTVNYTKERNQFRKPIHRFQAIQQQLSLLAGESVAVNTAANYAAEAYQTGSLSKEIAMAKIRANSACGLSATMAHQIHGAIGVTFEHTLHQTTRRLWSWRDEYGTEMEWGQILAEKLIQIGQDGLWLLLTSQNEETSIGEVKI